MNPNLRRSSVRFWDLETYAEKGKLLQCYSKEAASALNDGAPVNLCSVDWYTRNAKH